MAYNIGQYGRNELRRTRYVEKRSLISFQNLCALGVLRKELRRARYVEKRFPINFQNSRALWVCASRRTNRVNERKRSAHNP